MLKQIWQNVIKLLYSHQFKIAHVDPICDACDVIITKFRWWKPFEWFIN
jgi:hypothetical protein